MGAAGSGRRASILFGLPNMDKERTDYKRSKYPTPPPLILTHTWNGRVPGLKEGAPPADRPYAPIVFWTFRVMVGLGFLMFCLGLFGLFARVARRPLHEPPAASDCARDLAPAPGSLPCCAAG